MQKQLLTNITIIRPVLVVLLVFYHSFAIYGGGWQPIEGFPVVIAYWWLDKLSYAFMLETFVFVSGYVFGYQVRIKGEIKLEAKDLLFGKFKRLMIPSMVFSFLYILLLKDITQPIKKTFYDLVNGVGHLWFLPMLFWCFIAVWLIEKLKLNQRLVLLVLLLCSLGSFVWLPLQLNATLYYLFFFYVGYMLQRKNIRVEKFYKPCFVIGLTALFVVVFPVLTFYRTCIEDNLLNGLVSDSQINKLLLYIFLNLAKIVYSFIGLSMLFITVGFAEKRHRMMIPQWVVKIGELCMGVYLFQQFIIKAFYDHTMLPNVLGPYWLPWVVFVVTLLFSLVLSYLLRLTKMGRFLIG